MARLSSKHTKTLAAVFEHPTRSDVSWTAIVALVKALGGVVNEKRSGSRVGMKLGGRKFVIHSPHPQKTLSKASLDSLRAFLVSAGIPKPTQ